MNIEIKEFKSNNYLSYTATPQASEYNGMVGSGNSIAEALSELANLMEALTKYNQITKT